MSLSRFDAPELLDLNVGSLAETERSLADLRRINRWLGGTGVIAQHLYPRLARVSRQTHRPLVIADIGTGSADIPVAVVDWARRRQIRVQVLAVDLNQRHLALTRPRLHAYPEIILVAAEAGNLPLADNVDYVVASLFLHHFQAEDVARLLQSWYRLARYGVIANDLIRAWLPYLGYFAMQPWIARSYLTRYDAPLSIRRAYTMQEMTELTRRAAIPARLHWHWPWRMAVVADKNDDGR